MLSGGLLRGTESDYLLTCPWFLDYSRHVFHSEPAAFVQPLLEEMVRSGAARWHDERLVALTAYTKLDAEWVNSTDRWIPPNQWSK